MSSVYVSKNDGVSPVIGTILLVALTAILVGIVGAVLMGFASPEPAPILGISIVQQGNITTVTHLNGAVLPAGKFKILVDGVDKTAAFGGTGDFGPGMKLSWDSGAEKVGTVSIVYMSETGASMLIADKKIGKAGSGGGGGGGFLDKYTLIPSKNKQWAAFRDDVRAAGHGTNLDRGMVYVDNEEYWVSINSQYVQSANIIYNPSIQQYVLNYTTCGLTKIDLSKKIYNSSDMTPGVFGDSWKSTPSPVSGSLYEYEGFLYICQNSGDAGSVWQISRDPEAGAPISGDWLKIATIK